MTPHHIGLLAAVGLVCFIALVILWPVQMGLFVLAALTTLMLVMALMEVYDAAKTIAEARKRK